MDEHDDDVESIVHEDAHQETDSFPDTADDLDDGLIDVGEDPDDSGELDDDPAEL